MGLTKIGNKSIIKKMFGNKEILKEVFNGNVVYEKVTTTKPYLTFSSPNTFTIQQAGSKKTWDGTLEYSTDKTTWNTWDGTTTLNSSSTGNIKYLYMRGTNNTYITGNTSARYWSITGSNISISGNIENLLDYQDVENEYHPTMGSYAFAYWLYNNTSIVNCSNLILGSLTLDSQCYQYMFQGCTSLTTAPSILATTLASYCCNGMFIGCTSLKTPPALPATTLRAYCYASMFYGCTSLETAPTLPAIILSSGCYYQMFYGCTSLETAPTLPATTMSDSCYKGMFQGCTSLETVPALTSTSIAVQCYAYMFQDCASLTTLPALPATILETQCYREMFRNCPNIKLSTTQTGNYQTPYRIPISGTGTTGSNSLYYMFYETGGTFTGTPTINTTYYTSNTVI